MNAARISYSSFFTAVILLASCVEAYEPPDAQQDINFLVVDGFLDSGSKTAEVKLSIAVPLDTNTTYNPVRQAVVQVEHEDGTVIELPETAAGTYTSFSNKIETGKKYTLRVFINSKEYISDGVELKASPSLDSVSWRADAKGVTVYVDSHDVAGSTRYYQWIYIETWEYNAAKYSSFLFVKETGEVITRTAKDMTLTCYDSEQSTKVLVTSTTQNTSDVVNDFALTHIPVGSSKISRLYSIEVQQRALDEQAYTYWLNLQKTTENLGGLFDPLPNEVTGNMHNVTDGNERVLGYFSGGEIQKKRIFINRDELPASLVTSPEECPGEMIPVFKLVNHIGSELYLTESIGQPVPTAYISVPAGCADCRLAGGVLEKPAFWPPR
ncbi:MAG TPA: DUF4249 domain-containing protein [Cyclobacteriaceae bacterium]|nr:DUF4249 domain-containing protein [Cyclobacteriaceae bacterium]